MPDEDFVPALPADEEPLPPLSAEDPASGEGLGVASASAAGGEDCADFAAAAPAAAGVCAISTSRAGGRRERESFAAIPTATPKPRNATSSSADTCTGGSTRAHAFRASAPPGPPSCARACPSSAFHLRELGVALLQQRGAAQQHVVAEVVADRHLICEPAEVPVQLRHLRGQLLAAAFEFGAVIAGRRSRGGGLRR